MTLLSSLNLRVNSSNTSALKGVPHPPSRRGSEDFSALMRAKQQAGRVDALMSTQGQAGAPLGGSVDIAGTSGNPIGPRGDPSQPAFERGEFQHYGRDSHAQEPSIESPSAYVDPLHRALAHSAPPPAECPGAPLTNPAVAMEDMWRAVRRIAWGGDRQRGIAYIELGAGTLKGATLTLEARGKAISVVVDLPPGTSNAGWVERLAERLARRGLEVECVEVR